MRSTIMPIFTVSCALAGAAEATRAAAHAAMKALRILLLSAPGVVSLSGGDALVIARRDAPVVGASRRPAPVVRAADLVVLADPLHFGGVFDDAAVRAVEVAEDGGARSVATRSTDRRGCS